MCFKWGKKFLNIFYKSQNIQKHACIYSIYLMAHTQSYRETVMHS